MKKVFIKSISIIIVILMMTAFVSGCATKKDDAAQTASTQSTVLATTAEETEAIKEFVTIKTLQPGDETKGMQTFVDGDLKEKLKAELNIGIELDYAPWDQYWNKKDMMIAAGEDLDWYWDYYAVIPNIVSKKSFMPLNELMDQYGQDLKKVIPAENFKAFTFDGKLFAVPTMNAPTAEVLNTVLVRQDLLEGVGMTDIKTTADIELFIAKAKEKYPQEKQCAYSLDSSFLREISPDPLVIDGNIAINVKTNKAGFLALTNPDVIKSVYLKERECNKKGYYPEEVTLKINEHLGRMGSGGYLVGAGAISRPLENIADLRKNVPTGKYKEYLIAPEKGKTKFVSCSNYIVVGPKSKYPDRVVEFLNWIYKSQDNYNFILYGVKDKDYTISNNRLKQINYTDGLFYEWMFRNVNLMSFPDSVDDDFINTYKNWDKDATIPAFYGFIFNATPVQAEFAKVNTVITERFVPYSTGILDVEKTWDASVKALKDAGAEKITEEYQKQLDAYIASNK